MKKFLALVLSLIMVLSMVSLASAEDVELQFVFWEAAQKDGMQAVVDAYEAAHPGVKITISVIDWNEYWTKLYAGKDAQDMPDVFLIHSNHIFMLADAMLDLTDLNYDYTPYPAGITALYNVDGKQLAIPKDYDTIALAYNKDIFDAAGEPYPDDTWDWAKLKEVAQKLTDPEKGIWGFGAPNEPQLGYLNLIYQNGGVAYDPLTNTCGYNMEETKEAIQFWVDFQNEGISPTLAQFAELSNDERFKAGQEAMTFVGSWLMNSYNDSPVAGHFDLCVLPQGKTRASIYNGLGFAGSAYTKNPEIVKDFIAFCGTKEANILAAEKKAAIPAYAGTESYFTDNFSDINIACFPEMIAYGVQYPFSVNKPQWEGTETDLMNAIYAGEISVNDAMDQLYAEICEIEGLEP